MHHELKEPRALRFPCVCVFCRVSSLLASALYHELELLVSICAGEWDGRMEGMGYVKVDRDVVTSKGIRIGLESNGRC